MTVSDLIKRRGGPEALEELSRSTAKPVSISAVHKWRKNGIPEDHWGLFLDLEGVTPEVIYQANLPLRQSATARAA